MAKYRKKPVVIEAFKIKDILVAAQGYMGWSALPVWIQDAYNCGYLIFMDPYVRINTLEGWMTGDFDDYLIQGIKGEIYACKPDIFEATYEPMGDK
jgi:hypothetical protein